MKKLKNLLSATCLFTSITYAASPERLSSEQKATVQQKIETNPSQKASISVKETPIEGGKDFVITTPDQANYSFAATLENGVVTIDSGNGSTGTITGSSLDHTITVDRADGSSATITSSPSKATSPSSPSSTTSTSITLSNGNSYTISTVTSTGSTGTQTQTRTFTNSSGETIGYSVEDLSTGTTTLYKPDETVVATSTKSENTLILQPGQTKTTEGPSGKSVTEKRSSYTSGDSTTKTTTWSW